ncbi:AAA family ATPase [Undibacterium sp. Ren11W]|uniref:AAA family ATPase n=1 Tax=Undibacterium sp. Ren11W TaxID=3413045 RepID=UPI003BF04E38
MEIIKFRLINIGRFSEIDIHLAPTTEQSSNVTVFVGNNGSGKTSLLKSLATSLSWLVSRIRSEKGNGSPIDELDINNLANTGAIDIAIFDEQGQSANPDADEGDFIFNWTIAKTRKGRKVEQSSQLSEVSLLADHYRSLLSKDDKSALPLIAFYSVNRAVLDIPLKIKDKHTFTQLDSYDNSLSRGVDFRRFFEWFREREDTENESGLSEDVLEKLKTMLDEKGSFWEKLEKVRASSRDRQLTAVRTAIVSFMPGFSNLRVRRKPRLHMSIEKNGESLNVMQLSQGEKSLMALVGDLARRLAMMNPDLQNPLRGDGIVLIDEVELHLHPQWQRSLIERLTTTFPNIQFVLSTHSPLVISDSKNMLIYSLDDGDLTELPSQFGQDANSVLLEVMDTDIRNAQVNGKLNDLLDTIQDGDLVLANSKLNELENELPSSNIELIKARLLLRKQELRREKN